MKTTFVEEKNLDLAYADLPNAYRLNLSAEHGTEEFVATIETTFSDLVDIFGTPGGPLYPGDLLYPNEWIFVDGRNRAFVVAEGAVPSETFKGPYKFEIYAPSHVEGHDFARWLSDRVYAYSLTRDQKFVA